MKCMSCGAINPPEFIFCIESNKCGGCGGPIYNSETQELLKELAEAMEKMPNDPQGVAGWLLSNYRFQKMGKAEPVEKFHRKGSNPSANNTSSNLKVDPTYNDFIKRGDAAHLISKGAEIAQKRKGGGAIAKMAEEIQSISDPYGDDDNEPDLEAQSSLDKEDLEVYNALKSQGVDPFADSSSDGNGLGNITDISQAINPKDVVDFMSRSSSDAPSPIEAELSRTEEGRRVLERERFKKIKAQDAINGSGGGMFRR